MPDKMQRVDLAEKMPEGGQKPQRVADDRTQNDTDHSEAACQQHGKQDIPADLAGITDIVACLVPVGIDHLAQIGDHHSKNCVERGPAVIDQRKLIDLTVDSVRLEIHVSKQDQQQRAHPRDGDTQDHSLSVDLVRAALVHRADLPTVEDA